jgi:mono/diheme cytochrome c family protein
VRVAIVLSIISLVILGCERDSSNVPVGLFTSRAAQAAGAKLFASHCAICHGPRGDGQGRRREGMNPPPANLTLLPWSQAASAVQTFNTIRNGVRGTAMPSWSILSERQVWELIAYIHSLKT